MGETLGPPLPSGKQWNPDNVLSVENVEHAPATRERCDKAAALQTVFEDAVCHLVRHLINMSATLCGQPSCQLVWTGGCALNCLTSQLLLEHFGPAFYARQGTTSDVQDVQQDTKRLHLWVPPCPGDAGVAAGACIALAVSTGLPVVPLRNAFLCG